MPIMEIYSKSSEVISDWQWQDGSLKNIGDVITSLIPKETKSILDVGCGTGRLVAQLSKAGFDVNGIDVEKQVIEIGQSIFRNKGIKAKLGVYNLLTTPYPAEVQLDAITCSEVLEHVEEWQLLIEKMSELLKSGGSLIISVPRDRKQFSILDQYADHLRRFEDLELLTVLEKRDFRIAEVRYLGWPSMRSIVGIYSYLHKLLRLDHGKATEKRWGSRSKLNWLVNWLFYRCLKIDNFFSAFPVGTTIVVHAVKG